MLFRFIFWGVAYRVSLNYAFSESHWHVARIFNYFFFSCADAIQVSFKFLVPDLRSQEDVFCYVDQVNTASLRGQNWGDRPRVTRTKVYKLGQHKRIRSILDGYFFTYVFCKICNFVEKMKIIEKEAGVGSFF